MTSAIILRASEPPVSEKPEARLFNKGWAEEFFFLEPIRHILYV